MIKILPMIMIIFMALSMGTSRNAGAQAWDLSQYRWKNRLLLMFAPDGSTPEFNALQTSLAARDSEVADRDLVIFEILESAASRVENAVIASETAHALRERFNAKSGEFKIILIGKDGGVKLNRNDHTNLEEIFSLIDSMPMRQEEMRRKAN